MKAEIIKKNGDLELCLLTPDLTDYIKTLLVWENDKSIRHLHLVTRSEEEFNNLHTTWEELYDRVSDVHKSKNSFFWMVLEKGSPVCFLTAQLDPLQLLKKVPGTFWPSFLVGESSARGRGIGKQSMIWCEELAKEMNCKRVEIGVFEFNTVAQKLYESMGYVEFARTQNFTWWDGALRTDIRLEKYL